MEHLQTEVVQVPEIKIELVRWQGMSIEAGRIAQALEITDDTEEGMAVDTLSKIKTFQKETEGARKEHVQPFNELVKRVNDMFRPISDSLSSAEETIKGKMKSYRLAKERIRQEEERKRQEEYEKKLEEERKRAKKAGDEQKIVLPPPAVLPVATTSRGSQGAATAKKFWNYRVVDLAALYVARPDLVELTIKHRDTLAAVETSQTIPGLEIFEDMRISAR